MSTLQRVDYADAFCVEVDASPHRTAEQWARRLLEDAPAHLQTSLQRGWEGLGFRLGPGRCERFVAGWELQARGPDAVLLGANSRFGLQGQLLFMRENGALLYATFVQLDGAPARTLWAAVTPVHCQVVGRVLNQAKRASRLGA